MPVRDDKRTLMPKEEFTYRGGAISSGLRGLLHDLSK